MYFFFPKCGMNTLEFLSSNLLVPWLEMLSGESHNNIIRQNMNDQICIFMHCLCALCGYECLFFSSLFFPFTYRSYDLYWRGLKCGITDTDIVMSRELKVIPPINKRSLLSVLYAMCCSSKDIEESY